MRHRNDVVSWADMALVAKVMLRFTESVACPSRAAQTAIVPPRPWPTQVLAKTDITQASSTVVQQVAPWPSKARNDKAPGGQMARSGSVDAPTEPTVQRTEAVMPTKKAATPPTTSSASIPVKPKSLQSSPAYSPSQPPQLTPDVPSIPDATASSTSSSSPTPSPTSSTETSLSGDSYDPANERTRPLRATRVPSSRIGRLLHYGSLGAGLAWGSAGEYMRRATSGFTAHQDDAGTTGNQNAAPLFLSPRNVERLVDKLSTMRGAALKLGQFLSIQDSHMLPQQVEEVLLRVQNSAHYMPAWQLERVMSEELGSEWRANFASFDERPFAAASIGQVHSAVLADPFPLQPHLAGKRVAVKVQFPGVADSIVSDLANIKWLLTASALLPRGLFLENSVRQLQQELQEECDYMREAEMGRQFRKHVDTMSRPFGRLRFEAPEVVDVLSTRRVLTTEFMRGRPLVQVAQLDQTTRDMIAESVMELSLRELFDWHMMQTDPNWTNFLFHEDRQAIQLIDFGATRAYSSEFITMWLGLLRAAVSGDRVMCERWSKDIGYLSGNEPEVRMCEEGAHGLLFPASVFLHPCSKY